MKICDMHIHSNNSFDAISTVDELCLRAIEQGLYAIAITDHCEAPMIKDGKKSKYGYFDELIPSSVADVINARKKYGDKIKILCGIELGEPMHDIKCTEKALLYGNFDFVIASVHNLRGMDDFYYLDYNDENIIDNILKLYFAELAETASFEHFDTLAHLTYPLRYIVSKTGKFPDLTKYHNQIDEIFKILIKNNNALEINVSGLFKELNATLPDDNLIKRYRELGGKYITIGTDSHSADCVGKGIKEGIEIAKKCGFNQYTIFEKHKPIMIDI